MRSRIKNSFIILSVCLIALGCKELPKDWAFKENIKLDRIKPLGIILDGEEMWLTDVDNNRLVKTNLSGDILDTFSNFLRPMHISMVESRIYIPEFLNDTISIFENGSSSELALEVELDAPAGIDVEDKTTVIVDFYNHRLVLNTNNKTTIIGKKGHADGEFNYPTDVELFENKIFVADAYNNRVQVFDYDGNVLKVIGWQEDIRVATGLAVGPNRVYVTDFHGSRILIYDFEGTLINIFENQFDKPTDIYIQKDRMYIANYGGGFVSVFQLE